MFTEYNLPETKSPLQKNSKRDLGCGTIFNKAQISSRLETGVPVPPGLEERHAEEGSSPTGAMATTSARASLGHGSVQGQVGWSSEQPGLVEGVPAHGRGVGTR